MKIIKKSVYLLLMLFIIASTLLLTDNNLFAVESKAPEANFTIKPRETIQSEFSEVKPLCEAGVIRFEKDCIVIYERSKTGTSTSTRYKTIGWRVSIKIGSKTLTVDKKPYRELAYTSGNYQYCVYMYKVNDDEEDDKAEGSYKYGEEGIKDALKNKYPSDRKAIDNFFDGDNTINFDAINTIIPPNKTEPAYTMEKTTKDDTVKCVNASYRGKIAYTLAESKSLASWSATTNANFANFYPRTISIDGNVTHKTKITFKPDGGKFTLAGVTYNGKNAKTKNRAPGYEDNVPNCTKTGFTFNGWKRTSGTMGFYNINDTRCLTGKSGFTYKWGSTDSIVTAQWTENKYTIKYNGNGATEGTMADSTYKYTEEKALRKNAYKRIPVIHYKNELRGTTSDRQVPATFLYWFDSSNILYSDEEIVTELTSTNGATITLKVEWEAGNHTVLTPNAITGYTFSHWEDTCHNNREYYAGDEINPLNSHTFKAVYTPKSYTLTYKSNTTQTVSDMPSSQTKKYNEQYTVSSTIPTRSGYTFKGWYANSDCTGNCYVGTDKFLVQGNKTLYAKWQSNNTNVFTLYYNPSTTDEVTNMPEAEEKTLGQSWILSSKVPVRKHYTFNGWIVCGIRHSAGASIFANEDKTAWATWLENPKYTITYETGLDNSKYTIEKMPVTSTSYAGDVVALCTDDTGIYTTPICTNYPDKKFVEWKITFEDGGFFGYYDIVKQGVLSGLKKDPKIEMPDGNLVATAVWTEAPTVSAPNKTWRQGTTITEDMLLTNVSAYLDGEDISGSITVTDVFGMLPNNAKTGRATKTGNFTVKYEVKWKNSNGIFESHYFDSTVTITPVLPNIYHYYDAYYKLSELKDTSTVTFDSLKNTVEANASSLVTGDDPYNANVEQTKDLTDKIKCVGTKKITKSEYFSYSKEDFASLTYDSTDLYFSDGKLKCNEVGYYVMKVEVENEFGNKSYDYYVIIVKKNLEMNISSPDRYMFAGETPTMGYITNKITVNAVENSELSNVKTYITSIYDKDNNELFKADGSVTPIESDAELQEYIKTAEQTQYRITVVKEGILYDDGDNENVKASCSYNIFVIDTEEDSSKIRCISKEFLYTLAEDSKWRLNTVLNAELVNTLNKSSDDENCVMILHFSNEDIKAIKRYYNITKYEEAIPGFFDKFGYTIKKNQLWSDQ